MENHNHNHNHNKDNNNKAAPSSPQAYKKSRTGRREHEEDEDEEEEEEQQQHQGLGGLLGVYGSSRYRASTKNGKSQMAKKILKWRKQFWTFLGFRIQIFGCFRV